MKSRRVSAFSLLVVAAALIAGPGPKLFAASPCNTGAPMACCASEGDEGAPAPCGCSLNPVVPSPSVEETVPQGVVLVEAPLPAVAAEVLTAAGPAARVAPRARSAPLHLLYSVLLV
jgi:hypothetical protein